MLGVDLYGKEYLVPTPMRVRLTLLGILLVALCARVAAALVLPDQSSTLPDSIVYREAAQHLWSTGQLATPIYMPLYPAVVGLVGPGLGQLAFDIAASTIMVWLIFELTFLLFRDWAAALFAACAAALYPHFIFFSVVGLTETLFTMLVVAALVCWYRAWFVAGAVFAVLAILTRASFDLIAPVLLIYFVFVIHRLPLLSAGRQLATYAVIYVCLMSPWWVHNYHAYGSFIRLNLGAGLALFSGNNPFNKSSRDLHLDAHLTGFSGIADPVERDRAIASAAIDYIRAEPGAFVRRAWERLLRFWQPWPYTESYSGRFFVVVSALSVTPVMLFALLFLFCARWRTLVRAGPLIGYMAYVTLVNCVIVASIRYRVPIEPMLLIFAAGGLVFGLGSFRWGRRMLIWLGSSDLQYLARPVVRLKA